MLSEVRKEIFDYAKQLAQKYYDNDLAKINVDAPLGQMEHQAIMNFATAKILAKYEKS